MTYNFTLVPNARKITKNVLDIHLFEKKEYYWTWSFLPKLASWEGFSFSRASLSLIQKLWGWGLCDWSCRGSHKSYNRCVGFQTSVQVFWKGFLLNQEESLFLSALHEYEEKLIESSAQHLISNSHSYNPSNDKVERRS